MPPCINTGISIMKNLQHNFPIRTPQVLSRVRYQRSKPNLYISTEGPATHDALTFTFSNTSLSLLTFSHPAFDQPGPGYVMIYSIFFRFFALHMHDTQAFLLKIPQSGSIFLQQAITLMIIPFIHTLLRSLIFFFLLSSNISQVTD